MNDMNPYLHQIHHTYVNSEAVAPNGP